MPDTPDGRVTLAVLNTNIEHLTGEVGEVKQNGRETNALLRQLNGSVRQHETRITVLEHFCNEQVKPIIEIANENRLELATLVAKYGSIGIGGGGAIGFAAWLIGKSQGAW